MNHASHREIGTWRVIQVQITAFTSNPLTNQNDDWWVKITGEHARDTKRKFQEKTDSGIVDGFLLSLTTELLKITWIVAPNVDESQLKEMPPSLGTYTEVLAKVFDRVLPWFKEDCPPIKRIGFVVQAICKTDDREDAYRVLTDLLPSVRITPNSCDLLYRVNRKKPSVTLTPTTDLNRIATWTPMKLSLYKVYEVSGSRVDSHHLPIQDQFLVMLMVDVSTDAENEKDISKDMLEPLIRELSDNAMRIITDGDVE
jgi:hypothetical protein